MSGAAGNEYAATCRKHTQIRFHPIGLKSAFFLAELAEQAGLEVLLLVYMYLLGTYHMSPPQAWAWQQINENNLTTNCGYPSSRLPGPVGCVGVLELIAVLGSDIVRMQPQASLPVHILTPFCFGVAVRSYEVECSIQYGIRSH